MASLSLSTCLLDSETSMTVTFASKLILPMHCNADLPAPTWNTETDIGIRTRRSPFKDVLNDQLHLIKQSALSLSDSELVLNIVGCGHLTETFLLPAFKRVITEVPELRSKLKLVLTDAPSNKELAATKNGAGIERLLNEMQIAYEYYPSDCLSMDLLGSIKGVFNATPPSRHLVTCDWYLEHTEAPIFNEKPACLPDQVRDMVSLGNRYSGRLNHIDWVMGTLPFQWLMSQDGQDLLQRFGRAKMVNSYCAESWPVDPDRNGAPGQYGLLRRDPQIESEKGYDLGVGIANDCGIHPYFSALLFEMLTKGSQLDLNIESSGVAYARARRDHRDYHRFDDTAGTWTFSLGKTLHNVIFGKELNATFFGFDAVSQDSSRLLVCFGVPGVRNQYEQSAVEVPPYIVYVPSTNSSDTGECRIFDYASKDLYVGIVVNLLASSLRLPDCVRPNYAEMTNQFCLTGVERLALAKQDNYEIKTYEQYEPGSLPSMISEFSRNFGVPTHLG